MKKLIIVAVALVFAVSARSQDESPYSFTVVKDNVSTMTKDQCNTGTCWSFATLSFVESELIRLGKGEHDLSEMFNVRVTYPKKADNYVRYHGKAQFGAGSLSHDVINAIRDYGMVPESVYNGLNYGNDRHDHGELDALLEGMVKNLVEKNRGSLTANWRDAVESVLDVYFGDYPEKFEYQGET
jgi:bleomycin hydrolase